jgi:ribosome modulation factor
MTSQSLTSRPEACPGGCDHTDDEHIAFESGIAAGEAGKQAEDCPYEDFELGEAWLSGHSVGELNRNG